MLCRMGANMRIVLENQDIKVEIESFGAELKSIVNKETNQEYMWEADPAYWGKTSPILFPFIGKLEGEKFKHEGISYSMTKHGFARDMEFSIKESVGSEKVILGIQSNEETKVSFPFDFELEVEYSLSGKNVTELIRVKNVGSNKMYFNLGGHPAFACPLIIDGKRTGSRNDCRVKVYSSKGQDRFDITKINVATGLLPGDTYEFETDKGVFNIVDHIFDNDALVFENQGVDAVGFIDKAGKEYIRLEATNCPVWGIWSMPTTQASYACIEPWWGICDKAGYDGELKDRPYTNSVDAGAVWENGFTIYTI